MGNLALAVPPEIDVKVADGKVAVAMRADIAALARAVGHYPQ